MSHAQRLHRTSTVHRALAGGTTGHSTCGPCDVRVLTDNRDVPAAAMRGDRRLQRQTELEHFRCAPLSNRHTAAHRSCACGAVTLARVRGARPLVRRCQRRRGRSRLTERSGVWFDERLQAPAASCLPHPACRWPRLAAAKLGATRRTQPARWRVGTLARWGFKVQRVNRSHPTLCWRQEQPTTQPWQHALPRRSHPLPPGPPGDRVTEARRAVTRCASGAGMPRHWQCIRPT